VHYTTMAAPLNGSSDQDKLADLCSKNYKGQAVWFLNAFWTDFGEKEAKNIWVWKHKHDELDQQKKAQGNELDELNAHRFLEQINSPMTVQELRNYIRSIGVDKVKYVPLTHYLLARFKANLHKLVTASQGDNQEEVEKAQQMLDSAQEALRNSEAKAQEAAQAEAELKAALAELKSQEDAFNNKTKELERKTTEGGLVQQNRAKNELAQHLSSDPLPLRRAKLNTEAATRKAEKARLAADDALENARKKFEEAEKYLNEVQNRGGSAKGALWWINQELEESRKYMPQKKGGVSK